MSEVFKSGDLIIYQNGSTFQIGKVKRVQGDKLFVYYHEGDTAACTPIENVHRIQNSHCIVMTTFGERKYDVCRGCPYDCNTRQRESMIDRCLKYGQGGVVECSR